MHVLFVHQAYPAQFGHVARRLVADYGWECTFLSRARAARDEGVRVLHYDVRGTAERAAHHTSRIFENSMRQAEAVYRAGRRVGRRPDLIVGHSGFGSTLFLRDLFDCPLVNYFEYFDVVERSDLAFRPEIPTSPHDTMRMRAGNATVLLDLVTCDAGYCPTEWQRGLFPREFRRKLAIIPDGVDTRIWRRRRISRRAAGVRAGARTAIVTYVSRGFESIRGFDVFMRLARRLYEAYPDVLFVVVGEDRVCYGVDERVTGRATFKEYVLASGGYDLERFCFTGWLPAERLAALLSVSDLHIYLTVPFVLSWSLLNAMACGCVILASDTAPVREVIRHDENGLLGKFFDIEGLARQALDVLRHPRAHRRLGDAAAERVRDEYSLDRCLPRQAAFFAGVRRRPGRGS
jgi:glycosyltransferase involved in cell wall biosynthesis